jgi:tetratricopeptide (TPR) repeat protein
MTEVITDLQPAPPGETLAAARAAAARGEGFAALDLLRAAIAAPRALGHQWAAVAQFCAELGDDDAALAAARRLWAELPKSVPTAFILARALEATGRAAEAAAVLAPAAQAGQLSLAELYRLAGMLMFAGRLEEAETLTRRLLRQDPGNASLWRRLAQLKTFAAGDADLDALHRLQGRLASEPPAVRAAAAWALAKALVDCGDDRAAAAALEQTAALRRQAMAFDLDSIEQAARASLDAIPLAELQDGAGDAASRRPIFVLGPPRSGTTLVEQILSRHPLVQGGGELKYLPMMRHVLGDFTRAPIEAWLARTRAERPGADPWAEIRRRYLALADERLGAGVRFTDKLLTNDLRLAVIRKAFPGAVVVRLRRDPLDVAWSCWRADFTAESAWQSDPVGIARFVRWYERVLDAWAERFPGWIVNVDYEHLVEDPEWEIPALLGACGLEDAPQTRRPHESPRAVSTSSFAQVRAPIDARRVGATRAFPAATHVLERALRAEGISWREWD